MFEKKKRRLTEENLEIEAYERLTEGWSHLPSYPTGISCRKGHRGDRYWRGRECVECADAKAAKRAADIASGKRPVSDRAKARSRQNLEYRKLRTPRWLTRDDQAAMRKFYDEAARIKRLGGGSYAVDHIFPLLGRTVSGLDVPWNLRVMRSEDNLSKGNTLWRQDVVDYQNWVAEHHGRDFDQRRRRQREYGFAWNDPDEGL